MKTSGLSSILFSLAALALAGFACPALAEGSGSHDYEIAANDGYGLEDCLSTGGECGRVVADAWCEAHGHGHALSFGPRDAAEDDIKRVTASEETYLVRCGD